MMTEHKLFQIDFVKNNQQLYINQCEELHKAIIRTYGDIDTTKAYWQYNLFNVSCSSIAFYRLWKELNIKIREYVGDNRPLWMTGWLNVHTQDQVLDWHNHKLSICHGYVGIDTKNTVTEFKDYAIENKVGQLYIGPSEQFHRVVVKEPYLGNRITIAFDVSDRADQDHINSNFFSFIPVF
jgi:hypothetical protein